MTRLLYNDVETRWAISLKAHGSAACAAHPSAGVNCLAYAIDDDPIKLIPYEQCYRGSPAIERFHQLALEPDVVLVAHKAIFEILVYLYVLGIDLRERPWLDTMAIGRFYGYPGSLDDLAKALGSPVLKDIVGAGIMRKLVSGKETPQTAPYDFQRLYSYCMDDVETMRHCKRLLPDLPEREERLVALDRKINLRGVPLDLEAIHNALELKQEVSELNNQRMSDITQGFVTTVNQVQKLHEWVNLRGIDMLDCTVDTVRKTLMRPLPIDVRDALELRQEGGLSSLAKYEKMANQQVNGVLQDQFDVYGAHTRRFACSGVQVMNLARSENPEFWADLLAKAPAMLLHTAQPAQRLKDGLRGVIKAPEGYTLLGVDLKQIESRGTGWLAGEETLLGIYRSGKDVYCEYGSTMFGRKITKADTTERLASKAAVLSMGFAGGIGAYQRGCETYGTNLDALVKIILPTATPQEYAEAYRCYAYYLEKKPLKPLTEQQGLAADIVKQRFRRDFSRITEYWEELEFAFLHGGQAGPVTVTRFDSGLRMVVLPSGRPLYYHSVKVREDGSYSYQAKKGRLSIWKGTLIENMAQALNADISFWYMERADMIAPIVHHCHDEFTLLVPLSQLDEARAQLDALLSLQPEWTPGLPLDFDVWTSERYGK